MWRRFCFERRLMLGMLWTVRSRLLCAAGSVHAEAFIVASFTLLRIKKLDRRVRTAAMLGLGARSRPERSLSADRSGKTPL